MITHLEILSNCFWANIGNIVATILICGWRLYHVSKKDGLLPVDEIVEIGFVQLLAGCIGSILIYILTGIALIIW